MIYKTRDGNGNDIVKDIEIKDFKRYHEEITCPICKKQVRVCAKVKELVSSSFTDWNVIDGEKVCEECAKLFSLYFYSYIVDPDGIRLINVREIRDEITTPQKAPFRFIITTSQKKHLFYDAPINHNSETFGVKLERETIYTSVERQKYLFNFVETLYTLGASKKDMILGVLPFEVISKVGVHAYFTLQNELELSREIQIPLYCGQKITNISEEELICNLNSTLTT